MPKESIGTSALVFLFCFTNTKGTDGEIVPPNGLQYNYLKKLNYSQIWFALQDVCFKVQVKAVTQRFHLNSQNNNQLVTKMYSALL